MEARDRGRVVLVVCLRGVGRGAGLHAQFTVRGTKFQLWGVGVLERGQGGWSGEFCWQMLNFKGGIVLGFQNWTVPLDPSGTPGLALGGSRFVLFPRQNLYTQNHFIVILDIPFCYSMQCCTVSWTRAAFTHVEGELCHSCFVFIVCQ